MSFTIYKCSECDKSMVAIPFKVDGKIYCCRCHDLVINGVDWYAKIKDKK